MDKQKDFWESLKIPYQENEKDFEFVNPIVVSRQFVKMVGVAAYLGEQAEVLTEQLANLNVSKERAERELKKFRREVLSKNFGEITKSASSEIQDAFILKKSTEEGRLAELEKLERSIEEITREIETRQPRVDQYKAKLKLLENTLIWCKQYLDFDKLIIRSSNNT